MYILIVNPVAGSGRGLKVFDQLKQNKLYKKFECRAFLTEYEGHAEQITLQVTQLYRDNIQAFIIVGGDGTIHEVINGLKEVRNIPISYIPAGSGNDFARGYKIEGNTVEIFEKIVNRVGESNLWTGMYNINHRNAKFTRLFANSIGFGFDAEIVKANNQSRYKGWLNKLNLGSLSYVIALLEVLKNFKPKSIELIIDGKTQRLHDVWMVTIANHPYYGGGMKIIPGTKVQPKYLPVLIIRKISKLKVLFLFLSVFTGAHVKFKEVSIVQATSVQLKSDNPLFYQVDGQLGSCVECQINKQTIEHKLLGTSKK